MQVCLIESQISDHSLYHEQLSPTVPKFTHSQLSLNLPPGPQRFLK
jgi:hypothetical protein